MEHRLLGRTGLRISPLCLGAMNFGDPTPEADSIRIIHAALDAGINIVDTADMYGRGESERVVGRALAAGRRGRVVLATKAHFPMSEDPNDRGNSRRHLLRAVEASLQRLGTDWIDLYQIHRPDLDVPQDETLRALDDLVTSGKVRYVGCSTFPAWMVMEAIAISDRHGWARYVTEQPPYHLLDRRIENELVPFAHRHGLGLLTWSPLAMGMLAGRYDRTGAPPEGSRVARLRGVYEERVTDHALDAARRIAQVAEAHDLDPARLALTWVKNRPGVTAAIIGPRTLAHLELALSIIDAQLPNDIEEQLDAIVPPGTAASDFLNNAGWRSAPRPPANSDPR
ncbi:MAG: aldo/keto reductase [Planctomycetes bacterium]|nr:aldo/keto reductase [Planctomycetota bacterium]